MLLVAPAAADATCTGPATPDAPGAPTLLHVEDLASAHILLATRPTADPIVCVLVDLATPGAGEKDTWDDLAAAAGDTALVALAEDHDRLADLPWLGDHCDDSATHAEIAGPGLVRVLTRARKHASLTSRLRETESSHRQLTALVEATPDAVYTVDADGVLTSWNTGAHALFGYPAADVVGTHVELLHPEGVQDYEPIRSSIGQGRTVRALETVRRAADGRLVHVSLTVTPLLDTRGGVRGASVLARDISDRRDLETELVRAFMHDALTGLPNRALLVDRLSRLLSESAHDGSPVAVLFLDLDRFKQLNEAQGHFAGDRALSEVANRLIALGDPVDLVARLGGDEFVLVCRDTDTGSAAGLARCVMDLLSRPVRIEGRTVHLGASVGIAVSPPLESDAESLLRHADAAMHEAKARGRGRTQVFDVAFAERTRAAVRLADDLRHALEHDLLEVHYQPLVALLDGRLTGLEALARWTHPTQGPVSPGVFVPLAEQHGLVAELDRWVVRRACGDAAAARRTGRLPLDAHVSVNLSARSLADPDLVRLVRDTLVAEELPPEALVLEITETAVLHDLDSARRTLRDLRDLGTGVALDDFGTGYSSLSFLRQLPVTQVKIDRSFVTDVTTDTDDQLITASVVDLARGLGLETVAEGVESEAQASVLRRLGCSHGQGYWWSEPVPINAIGSFDLPGVGPGALTPAPRRWLPRRGRLATG